MISAFGTIAAGACMLEQQRRQAEAQMQKLQADTRLRMAQVELEMARTRVGTYTPPAGVAYEHVGHWSDGTPKFQPGPIPSSVYNDSIDAIDNEVPRTAGSRVERSDWERDEDRKDADLDRWIEGLRL